MSSRRWLTIFWHMYVYYIRNCRFQPAFIMGAGRSAVHPHRALLAALALALCLAPSTVRAQCGCAGCEPCQACAPMLCFLSAPPPPTLCSCAPPPLPLPPPPPPAVFLAAPGGPSVYLAPPAPPPPQQVSAKIECRCRKEQNWVPENKKLKSNLYQIATFDLSAGFGQNLTVWLQFLF